MPTFPVRPTPVLLSVVALAACEGGDSDGSGLQLVTPDFPAHWPRRAPAR